MAAIEQRLEEKLQAYRALRTDCLFQLYIMSGCTGASMVVLPDSALLQSVSSVTLSILATQWAIADAKVRGISFLRIAQEIYFFSWPLAAGLYLIHTRGRWGLALYLANLIALVLIWSVAMFISMTLFLSFGETPQILEM